MTIPKIIHQLWIGPKTSPTKLMDTWKNIHEPLGFQYIRWTEKELEKRGFKSSLMNRVNEMEEINGKADILRWEILYEYGGVFVDADSVCIEPFTYLVEKYKAFAGYENEQVRGAGWAPVEYNDVLASTKALIATGTMAFPPKHELPKLAIQWIKNNEVSFMKTKRRAWRTVGPGLLTRLYYSKKWADISILPSYYFLPVHASGLEYTQHGRVFAFQEWGSTKNSYATMNNNSLPDQFLKPKKSVSILISSLNTKAIHVKECLESIKSQMCHIFLEIIWINDGSDAMNTTILKKLLKDFENTTRYCSVVYNENDGNKGIGFTLNKGILMCSNDLIIKMDSDDIMMPSRIKRQVDFMNANPDIAICGGQIQMFHDNGPKATKSNHPSITFDEYKKNPNHWFINHPTVCYRKHCVLKAGNYDKNLKEMAEDFELELRMLKTFGKIHNLPDILLYYRLHPGQITHRGGKKGGQYWNTIRNNIVKKILN